MSTGTLITISSITASVITLTDVTYGSNGTASTKYNFTNLSSTASWNNVNYSGGLTGDAKERNDSNNSIQWGANTFYWIASGATNWNSAPIGLFLQAEPRSRRARRRPERRL